MDDLLLVRMSHAEVVHKPLFHEGGLRGALVERAFYAAGDDTDGGSAAALSARWDPNDAAHVVVAEASGALRSVRALDGSDGALATSLTRYQLHRKGTALNRAWEQVELVPKVPGGLLFFQRDSNKLLYSTLVGLNLPEGRSCEGGSPPDAPSSRVFCVGQHPGPLSRMAVRPDGALVAAGTAHGSLRLWRLADGTATAAEAAAHGGAVTAVAFSGEFTVRPRNPDLSRNESDREMDGAWGRWLVVTRSTPVATGGDDGAVRVWLPDALGRLRLLHQLHTMGDAPVRCLTVYSSLLLKRVRCGDFLPDAPPPSEHRSVLEAMADAPVHSGAGDLLAVGTDDGTLHVWKAAAMTATSVHDGTVWRVACVDHDPKGWAVTHVAIRSDGKQVVAAASNTAHERPSVHEGVYRAYDTTTFAQCQEMSTLRAPVAAEFATSPLFRHRRTLLACTAAGPPRLLDASMLEVHEVRSLLHSLAE